MPTPERPFETELCTGDGSEPVAAAAAVAPITTMAVVATANFAVRNLFSTRDPLVGVASERRTRVPRPRPICATITSSPTSSSAEPGRRAASTNSAMSRSSSGTESDPEEPPNTTSASLSSKGYLCMSPGKSSRTSPRYNFLATRCCRSRCERPVLGDAHRARALADDLGDLLDVEITEHAQQHDLGLILGEPPHERFDRTLRGEPADRQASVSRRPRDRTPRRTKPSAPAGRCGGIRR